VTPGRAKVVAAALLLAAAAVAHAAQKPVDGIVTKVTSGDTLWVTPTGAPPVEVKLTGIEAPAVCQPWGPEARGALQEMVLQQHVELRPGGRDRAGRVVGTVLVGGVDVGRRMVEEGHAWSARLKWDRGPFVKQERMAHSLGRGLHGTPGALRPSDWRRLNGACP